MFSKISRSIAMNLQVSAQFTSWNETFQAKKTPWNWLYHAGWKEKDQKFSMTLSGTTRIKVQGEIKPVTRTFSGCFHKWKVRRSRKVFPVILSKEIKLWSSNLLQNY